MSDPKTFHEAKAAGSRDLYDVAIVGYGPGGEVLASTLGAAGLRVVVVERWPQPYPLPRLTTLCGECCRIIQATGRNIDQAFSHTLAQASCNFVDAEGAPLLTVPYPGEIGGWPSRVSMFQPDIERAIADKVEAMTNVEVLRGWEAAELWQNTDGVHLVIVPFARSDEKDQPRLRTLRAKYVVGADGARSFVRQALVVPLKDFGLHERWLNYDAENLKPLADRFMDLNIYMDPARPHMYMPIGKRGLRLEFRVMDGEADEDVMQPGVAEEFMQSKYGLDPTDVRIMRRVVYHYRTRLAEKWRVGRVFLIGDAAHTMPPYMGQGAAAAIRDGRNLGWKLIEVLTGRSDEALLDTYQIEREPHQRTIQDASSRLSDMVNMSDPVQAKHRNEGMRKQGVAQPPELPSLTDGVLHRTADDTLATPAGAFSPQGRLRVDDTTQRGDDILGSGFQLWLRGDAGGNLGAGEHAWLRALDCSIAVLQGSSPYAVEDVDGTYLGYLDNCGADAVIVRPDFHVFGAAKFRDLNALVGGLAAQLRSTTGPLSMKNPPEVAAV
jgi:3-(3-hydroxy-phenyl)propionate hydroxylase